MNLKPDDKVYVAGQRTMIGAALMRVLQAEGFKRLVPETDGDRFLRDVDSAQAFFERNRPQFVFAAAGESAGILGNQKRSASLMADNLAVNQGLFQAAHATGVQKLVYVASSCVYPKHAPQPMVPASLMTGPLEPTSASYATAKIAGMEMGRAFRLQHNANFVTAIVGDVYGPGENYMGEDTHVVAGLLRRFHVAKTNAQPVVEVWGTGMPRRDFVYADDSARGLLAVMRGYDGAVPINVGHGGQGVSIQELAEAIAKTVGYAGRIHYDTTRPDGTPLKILDSSVVNGLGWRASTPLLEALRTTYDDFLRQLNPSVTSHAN